LNDPLLSLPGYVLRRAASAAQASLNVQLRPLGVRAVDAALLLLIDASAGLSQSQAGRILDIQRSNMVALVLRLERRGAIERRAVDGRSSRLCLTRRGRTLLAQVRRVIEAHEAMLLQRVPARLRPSVLPILLALWSMKP
jgi:DNA-binding MarR family transcriptional regulator